jgi:hypothetical protein
MLLNGIGYRDNWKGIGIGSNMLAVEPYKYFVANAYSLYLKTLELLDQRFSPLTSSSTPTLNQTTTHAEPKKKHKRSGSEIPAVAIDQALNLSTATPTTTSSSLDVLFPAIPDKKK